LLIVGCGGGDDDGDDAAASGSRSGETVSVEHVYGTTTVEGRPSKVVSLDTQWTDVLIALGEPPVGYVLDPNVEGGSFPWRDDQLADSTGISTIDGVPYEQVAALQPDLIVGSYLIEDEAAYRRLSEIAPTIPLLGSRDVDPWQDMATVAGDFLGDPSQAAGLVADAEALTAGVRAELPGLEGKTVAMANYVPGDAIYVVSDPEDGANVLFEQLGLSLAPTILDAADGSASGRVELSLENVGMLDADVLVLFTNGADPTSLVGYSSLPAVRGGTAVVLDYAAVVGLNTPTPLSIPYSLELIRPALDAAGSGLPS
jgi:iron complex transport system substrate-binding protein